eukprot:Hpha_TRINITY_DN3081_c0_g1::TRINITY_DN3081_c0_g1_i1::g.138630::m.138630
MAVAAPRTSKEEQDDWSQERLLRIAGPEYGENTPVRITGPDWTSLVIVHAECGPRSAPLDCTSVVASRVRANKLNDILRHLWVDDGAQQGRTRDYQFVVVYRAEVRFRDEMDSRWGKLSISHDCEVEVKEPVFPFAKGKWKSLERFLLACKFTDVALQEEIFYAPSLKEARIQHLVKDAEKRGLIRPDWESKREDFMYKGLRAKFKDPDCHDVLLNTAGMRVVWMGGTEWSEASYWGVGSKGEGMNRLGSMLGELYRETTLEKRYPEVPSALFFSAATEQFEDADFSTDNFVRTLTHKLLEGIRGMPGERGAADAGRRQVAQSFRSLFDGAVELLEMHKARADQERAHCNARLAESGEVLKSRAQQQLVDVEPALRRLETSLARVKGATLDVGEMIAVTERQIQRAQDARALIRQFNAFCALGEESMSKLVTLLTTREERQREKRKADRERFLAEVYAMIAKGRIVEIGEDYDDDLYDIDECNLSMARHATKPQGVHEAMSQDPVLQEVMQSHEYRGMLDQFKVLDLLAKDSQTVQGFVKIKELVKGWSPGRNCTTARRGIRNVSQYDQFLVNALLGDSRTQFLGELSSLQEGLYDALKGFEKDEVWADKLAAALDGDGSQDGTMVLRHLERIYMRPMRRVVELLTTLGHKKEGEDRYLQTVFMYGSALPEDLCQLLAPESDVSRCVRVEAYCARRVFHPHHQLVLREILTRIAVAHPTDRSISLRVDARLGNEHSRRMRGARELLQRLLGSTESRLKSLRDEHLVRDSESGQVKAKQRGELTEYLLEIHRQSWAVPFQEVLTKARDHLDEWVQRLDDVYRCCFEWLRRVERQVPEAAESIRKHMDDVFADLLKEYQGEDHGVTRFRPDGSLPSPQGLEGWLIEAVFATMPPSCGGEKGASDVVNAMHAAQAATRRLDALCTKRRRFDLQVSDMCHRLQKRLLDRFRETIFTSTDALRQEQERGKSLSVGTAYHELLRNVSWAVVGREILSQNLSDFSKQISPGTRQELAEVKYELQRELEHVLSAAVRTAVAAVAVEALSTVTHAQERTDYNPRDRLEPLDPSQPTLACKRLCLFLQSQIEE